jgi:hypothetical protein
LPVVNVSPDERRLAGRLASAARAESANYEAWMKGPEEHMDRYAKAVLTVIALCLVWICLRDLPLGPAVSAQGRGLTDRGQGVVKVQIVSIDEAPLLRWEALPVESR